MQHFKEGGNYLKLRISKCGAARSHGKDEEGTTEFGPGLLPLQRPFCLNRCLARKGGAALCFVSLIVFMRRFVTKMAFSNNNGGYFPFPPLPLLICFDAHAFTFSGR